jgi:hypothetical protein
MKRYPIILVGLYLASELIANITASKLTSVGPFVVPAGVYIFTLSYTLLDLINHILGKKEAHRVVLAAFVGNALLALYIHFAIALEPAGFWSGQNAFVTTLGSTPRIVLASLTAYLVSANMDVLTYAWLIQRVKPWARVLLSNGIGLLLDTVIFITIAFAGVAPLGALIVGQYSLKMAVTVVTIPLIYLTRHISQLHGYTAQASQGPVDSIEG